MSFGQLVSDMGMVLWVSGPLFGANMLAVVTGRGGHPIDGGRFWIDGERVLGDGKTWEGFLLAPIVATALTEGLAFFFFHFPGTIALDSAWQDALVPSWLLGLSLGYGALIGDVVKSFCKRRGRNPRGAAWPFWDQFDAVIGGFFISWLFCQLIGSDWFTRNLVPGRWHAVVIWLPLYWLLHRFFSVLAHRRGLKSSSA